MDRGQLPTATLLFVSMQAFCRGAGGELVKLDQIIQNAATSQRPSTLYQAPTTIKLGLDHATQINI